MNSKIIAGTCILSLAFTLCACGPINETYEQVEFTESTIAETAASTTTALTGSLTAVSSNVSTVTTLNTTTALTSVTDGSTSIGDVLTEIEVKLDTEQHYNNAEGNTVQQPSTAIEQVRNTEYNDTKSTTTAIPAVTTVSAVTTTVTEHTAVSESTAATEEAETTTAETTAKVEDNQPYLVYKPSTKYAHRSTCRWNKDDAYRCDDFSDLETRICTECNPEIGDHIEYQTPTVGNANKDNMNYVGNFKMTYYPATHYYPGVCGGSTRTLIGYGTYDNGIRGSVASRSLYETYGYERDGRTTIYLEFSSYPEMNGWYYLDDYCAFYGVIDVFVWDEWSCPFGYDGITWADCWIY